MINSILKQKKKLSAFTLVYNSICFSQYAEHHIGSQGYKYKRSLFAQCFT